MAGIQFQCPYCEEVSDVPAAFAGKRGKCPACEKVIEVPDPAAEGDGFEAEDAPSTKECKACGEAIKAVARKCRHCGEFQSKEDRESRRRTGGYAACPVCPDGGRGAESIGYTWWGGIFGPRLMCHVRCLSCRGAFNGKTGKSNNTAIAIYFVVTLGLVAAVLIAMA